MRGKNGKASPSGDNQIDAENLQTEENTEVKTKDVGETMGKPKINEDIVIEFTVKPEDCTNFAHIFKYQTAVPYKVKDNTTLENPDGSLRMYCLSSRIDTV
eukprot:GHVS01099890.1.p1 GENE.GHVS01099890.1~~GHVS01099890.1.p1  ORF type:complete len:101 (+),score=12.67 GHVS01099890.1:158-460(+)